MKNVLLKLNKVLKKKEIIYASFKLGEGEEIRNERINCFEILELTKT